jgi:hypothetical protein
LRDPPEVENDFNERVEVRQGLEFATDVWRQDLEQAGQFAILLEQRLVVNQV